MIRNFLLFPLLVAVLLLDRAPALAQVNLVLSQPAMSNYFTGRLSIQITGLTNGEPVLLQKFVDVNDNGLVDVGEALVGQFKLTEGQVARLGGVRNKNVPGDADETANGVITETFDFADTTDFAHHVASYVFRVSSPGGRFADQLQRFAVTNSTLGQAVTGTVTGVPNAFVILLSASADGELFAGGIANGSGVFSISCPPGNYQVLATKSGMVTDFGTAPTVTVGAGVSTNVNLSLSPATQTISGTLTNAATGGILPGVKIFLKSATDFFALGHSDSNGLFNIPVTAGLWTPEAEETALTTLGYLGAGKFTDINTTGGSVTGVVMASAPATALFFGNFRDSGSNAIAGMPFSARSQNLSGRGLTDASGYYTVGVVAGTWNIGPETAALTARRILASSTNVTVADGQAVQINFTSRTVTAHLTGQVIDNFGVPLTNFQLVVQPVPFPPDGAGSYYPSTDNSGNFDIGVSAGTWNIALESERTAASNLVSFSIDRVVQDNVNQSGLVFVAYRATQPITGFVREGGTGVTNVQMYGNAVINGTNYLSGASYTDGSGNYLLKVINASWNVQLNNFDLNQRGYVSASNQTVVINNAAGVANFSLTRFSNTVSLSSPRLQGSQFSLEGTGDSGRTYVLEATANLRLPITWLSVATNTQNGASFQISDN